MIDISQETLIPIRDVPRRLPPRPNGKRVHISAVYRWIGRGIRGRVLESIKIGGSTYTSIEALQRFADRLHSAPVAGTPTISRQKAIEKAQREVDEILGLSKE